MNIRALRIEVSSLQRGFAMIALLALAALISAFLIASALNLTSAGNSNEREDRSMTALRKAKAALIAYAANEQWQLYKGQVTDQPGALPCPDINHDGTESDEGNSDCVGVGISSTTNLIGRIPWKSLGIDDLRDASGERLWYALSFNFRKLSGTTVINSDTQACDTPACNPVNDIQLTVTGTAPASNVVAIIFAPGQALDLRQIGGPLQIRPADHTNLAYKDPINYLENFSLGDVTGRHYTFSTNAISVDTFNDRLLVITQADLMAAVEPVVAARIERDVKPLLKDYFNNWAAYLGKGAYPFAVPFTAPPAAQSTYLGVSGQTVGLLPLTNTAAFTWQNPTVTQIPPGDGTSTVTSAPCSISSLTVTCTVNYTGGSNDRPDIRLQVLLANVNVAFADTPSSAAPFAENLAMLDGNGDTPPNQGSPYGEWSKIGSPPRVPTMTWVAQGGGVVLTYTGRLQNAADMNHRATITVPLPAPPCYLSRLPAPANPPCPANTNPNIAWFLSNQWYSQTFFAVSPDFLPGGGSNCVSNPPCLTVKNLSAPLTNGQAILILAGRSLNGTARPSANPKDYLEGENCNLTAGKDLDPGPSTCTFWTNSLKPNDNVYEHRAGVPTAINDRVVVVSPP